MVSVWICFLTFRFMFSLKMVEIILKNSSDLAWNICLILIICSLDSSMWPGYAANEYWRYMMKYHNYGKHSYYILIYVQALRHSFCCDRHMTFPETVSPILWDGAVCCILSHEVSSLYLILFAVWEMNTFSKMFLTVLLSYICYSPCTCLSFITGFRTLGF